MTVSELQPPFSVELDTKESLEPGFYDKIFMVENMQKVVSPFEIKTSIHNCFACDNKKFNKTLELGNFDASVMIIGQTPADVDFNTSEGKLLADTLTWAKYDLNDVYFTSLIKCEDTLTPEKCHHHLLSELLCVRPKLILALGYDVGKYFDPMINQAGYTSRIMGNYDMITTYRTSYAMSENGLFQSFCNDVLRGKQHVSSTQ